MREFRLGLSQGVGLVAKARERGFTIDEIRAAGLANQRGNDYFPFRLMFPLADARGRIVGFQARRLRDDDPLKGKYVNTPESELFKRATSCTASTSRGPRSPSRTARSSSRATPT